MEKMAWHSNIPNRKGHDHKQLWSRGFGNSHGPPLLGDVPNQQHLVRSSGTSSLSPFSRKRLEPRNATFGGSAPPLMSLNLAPYKDNQALLAANIAEMILSHNEAAQNFRKVNENASRHSQGSRPRPQQRSWNQDRLLGLQMGRSQQQKGGRLQQQKEHLQQQQHGRMRKQLQQLESAEPQQRDNQQSQMAALPGTDLRDLLKSMRNSAVKKKGSRQKLSASILSRLGEAPVQALPEESEEFKASESGGSLGAEQRSGIKRRLEEARGVEPSGKKQCDFGPGDSRAHNEKVEIVTSKKESEKKDGIEEEKMDASSNEKSKPVEAVPDANEKLHNKEITSFIPVSVLKCRVCQIDHFDSVQGYLDHLDDTLHNSMFNAHIHCLEKKLQYLRSLSDLAERRISMKYGQPQFKSTCSLCKSSKSLDHINTPEHKAVLNFIHRSCCGEKFSGLMEYEKHCSTIFHLASMAKEGNEIKMDYLESEDVEENHVETMLDEFQSDESAIAGYNKYICRRFIHFCACCKTGFDNMRLSCLHVLSETHQENVLKSLDKVNLPEKHQEEHLDSLLNSSAQVNYEWNEKSLKTEMNEENTSDKKTENEQDTRNTEIKIEDKDDNEEKEGAKEKNDPEISHTESEDIKLEEATGEVKVEEVEEIKVEASDGQNNGGQGGIVDESLPLGSGAAADEAVELLMQAADEKTCKTDSCSELFPSEDLHEYCIQCRPCVDVRGNLLPCDLCDKMKETSNGQTETDSWSEMMSRVEEYRQLVNPIAREGNEEDDLLYDEDYDVLLGDAVGEAQVELGENRSKRAEERKRGRRAEGEKKRGESPIRKTEEPLEVLLSDSEEEEEEKEDYGHRGLGRSTRRSTVKVKEIDTPASTRRSGRNQRKKK